jgi:hypothetical protein
MSYDFFRKERPEVFEKRFSVPTLATEAYGLKSHVIFEAKGALKPKHFRISLEKQGIDLTATVSGSELLVTNKIIGDKPKITLRLSEANMADALKARNEKSVIYLVAAKLCKDHATSSASSPLISGCIQDNFAASKSYDGYKLCLKLLFRQPFVNPFVSGLEKEYFLIGQVLDTDCTSIQFFGRTNQNINELVNPFGS